MSRFSFLFLALLVVDAGALRMCFTKTGCEASGSIDETSLLQTKKAGTPSTESVAPSGQRGHSAAAQNHLRELSKSETAEFLMEANDMIAQGKWGLSMPKVTTSTFDSKVGDRSFVAAAQLNTKIGPLAVHPFDLAFYIEKSSPLWGKQNTIEDLKNNAHTATVLFKTTQVLPTFIPLTTVKTVVKDMVMPYVKAEGLAGEHADALMALQFSGSYKGKPPLGSVTTVTLDAAGAAVNIAGESVGRLDNPAMSRAAVGMCVSKDSPVPGFSDSILARLAQGGPA